MATLQILPSGVRVRKRIARLFLLILIFAASVIIGLGWFTNISTQVTSSDESIFRSVLNLQQPKWPLTFEEEITLIARIQQLILQEAPIGPPIPDYADREPEDLMKHRSGLCYDRSRTFDKLYTWMGFQVRHVYILYPDDPLTKEKLPYWRAFFTRGTASHAVTEVKTQKGWLLIDSNSNWISLTKDGRPINADHIEENAANFMHEVPHYFNQPYLAIRGLYSRRGQLYRPYIPYPQLNWQDFTSWMFNID